MAKKYLTPDLAHAEVLSRDAQKIFDKLDGRRDHWRATRFGEFGLTIESLSGSTTAHNFLTMLEEAGCTGILMIWSTPGNQVKNKPYSRSFGELRVAKFVRRNGV